MIIIGVAGLSKQLTEQVNCIQQGAFKSLAGQPGIRLGDAALVVPYAQKAVVDQLVRIAKDTGDTIYINSALRTLPQQLLLYNWQDAYPGSGGCGITVAAPPGDSNHNGGLAVDISDSSSWIDTFARYNLAWLGAGDPPHFDYVGGGQADIRSASVKAFQILWNINNPNDKIAEDGIWGPGTESRIRNSPAEGFPKGASCGISLPGIDPLSCTNDEGKTGKCQDVSSCTGKSYPGLCAGASNIQCCVKSASSGSDPVTTTPSSGTGSGGVTVPQNDCEKTYGVIAKCGNPSVCSNALSGPVSNLCPGDSTNACCLNFSLKKAFEYQDASNTFQKNAMDKFQKSFLSTSTFLPKFQTFSCLYRNKITSADKWNIALGYCGEAISFRLTALYYSVKQESQNTALDYLQGEIMKISNKEAYYTFIREFRNVASTGSGSGSGSGAVTPPPPPVTNTGCSKKNPSGMYNNFYHENIITFPHNGYCNTLMLMREYTYM
jgi:hypothetical protein